MEINKESKSYKYYEKILTEKPRTQEEFKQFVIYKLLEKENELLRAKEIIFYLQNYRDQIFFNQKTNPLLANNDIYTFRILDKNFYINIPTRLFNNNYEKLKDHEFELAKRKQSLNDFKDFVSKDKDEETKVYPSLDDDSFNFEETEEKI